MSHWEDIAAQPNHYLMVAGHLRSATPTCCRMQCGQSSVA
jgi:hypothetical protein